MLLDGASITRSENGSSFDETSPSIEALQEFKVTTSTPSAEFGRTTAGLESFSVKSGTNSFHGTGFGIVNISFAMAIGQLMWGAVQPLFGMFADRHGPVGVRAYRRVVRHESNAIRCDRSHGIPCADRGGTDAIWP